MPLRSSECQYQQFCGYEKKSPRTETGRLLQMSVAKARHCAIIAGINTVSDRIRPYKQNSAGSCTLFAPYHTGSFNAESKQGRALVFHDFTQEVDLSWPSTCLGGVINPATSGDQGSTLAPDCGPAPGRSRGLERGISSTVPMHGVRPVNRASPAERLGEARPRTRSANSCDHILYDFSVKKRMRHPSSRGE